MSMGTRATQLSRNTPCHISAKRVRAPLSMLALLRTISEIMGRPPMDATAVLAIPTAIRSRFMLVLRFQGSIMSMALALSIDSSDPMSANITTHFHPAAVCKAEKSGCAMAWIMLLGTVTKYDSLSL